MTQRDKALRFRALHQAAGAFVIANPWDAGSARILAGLGFPALATSSGAMANTLGRRDGGVTREEALEHARAIVDATDLPVSADLERGFGDAPEDAAQTIRLAALAGLVGGSIEDATGNPAKPLYAMAHATERVAAAVEAAHALDFPFILTARRRASCAAIPTWMTPSFACKRSKRPGRMCCSPRGFRTSQR
ncbi:MAG: isocitrate lyase/phosphoenolpyruvate mutase family protein [Usitatibacter sp.]